MAYIVGTLIGAAIGTFLFALLVSFLLSKVTSLSRKKRLALGYLVIVVAGSYVKATNLEGDFTVNFINSLFMYSFGGFVCMLLTHGLGDPDSLMKARAKSVAD